MKQFRKIALLAVVGIVLTYIIGGIHPTKSPTVPLPVPPGAISDAPMNTAKPSQSTVVNQSKLTATTARSASATQVASPYPEKVIPGNKFIANSQKFDIVKYSVARTPNDTYGSQWWVAQTGLETAWDSMTGANTSIAIIDTGFALDHEEFAGRWLDNTGESGATTAENIAFSTCTAQGLALNKTCNGIDDDSNGYVDDYRGWDFISDEPSTQAGETNAYGSAVWHASAVAGVAAATGNNATGLAGVSWGTKILPLQALDDEGDGDTLSVARAIVYAVDRQVDVINLSLGSEFEDPYIREVIKYALENGVIVVAAAGNDGCDCMSYPANYPEVIAVGASDSNGTPASFSSYGTNLDVLAPGASIRSSSWNVLSPTNAYTSLIAGTSFAAPYISGLLANSRALQPRASWGQLVHSVMQTSDHRTLTPANPRSNNIGFGYVRADNLHVRLANPYYRQTRYAFTLNNSDSLSAATAIECESGQYPTAPFYEITEGTSVYYSISELAVYKKRQAGANATQKGYVCTGLPTDTIDTVRLINPAREFSNRSDK